MKADDMRRAATRTMRTLAEVHREIAVALDNLSALLDPRMKLTFIANMPGRPETEIVVTNAALDDLRAVIDRSERREPRSCPPGECVYVRQRTGGSPESADANEVVSLCRDCGREEPGSGEFPSVVYFPTVGDAPVLPPPGD